MKCPYCGARDARVIDSRELNGGESIRRRRECSACGRRFTTYERVEPVWLMVVKRDGRREPFDVGKLREGLRLALKKRPVSPDAIDRIVATVERELQSLGTTEVTSTQIGEIVLRELKQLDEVAYIRFASVYRRFADLEDLRREMEALGWRPQPVPVTDEAH
ncbi:transcriptional regulator NrdR [Thermomicrobium sp. 4228-Ro]|uniref:transcriptional regulator NrdR n=1 Tax=Thermomicrobium sp. 4228-Ro TaxID=2993937 RepID=UPI002248A574|nr:transcriptional regulator NrdR [Thermomicrobium sp. 4228-Ro]MCX2727299.1 transcriptional regulator NrdR [Thermomicrobium sp. 4228-Ro]